MSCLVAALGLLLSACAVPPQTEWQRAQWRPLHAREGVSLRGISVVDDRVIWASGSGGTVLRSVDGGRSWQDVPPPNSVEHDYRDIHAFDADAAVAMVAGQPARVYRTSDGGASWILAYEEPDPRAFFDTITFSGDRGFLFGDPHDGAFCVLRSDDRGVTWRRVGRAGLPAPVGAEAGFAASGTCLDTDGEIVRIGTGGEASRCLISEDGGLSWSASRLPLLQGLASQGAFSLAFRGDRGVVVGGDYRAPEREVGSSAWTRDGGRTWRASPSGAGGYRSAAIWLDESNVLAVGEGGASLSRDQGVHWQPFGDRGFHAVAAAPSGRVFACGSDGRIAELEIVPPPEFTVMSLFGDHMVLPPSERVAVRGRGVPGARVRVRASWGGSQDGVIDDEGRWSCELATPGRGGPHTVTVSSGARKIVMQDVLIGDVWLASGQSNMEMPIGDEGGWKLGIENWQSEVAEANHPTLRVFSVARRTSGVPLHDVEGEWQVCSPENAAGFSAAAYFFARELVQRGKGPIGVVVSSWGGTVCEAWTRGEALGPFPEFAEALQRTRQPEVEQSARLQEFWRAVPEAPIDGAWEAVGLPGLWSNDGLGDFDGVAFYRKQVALPAQLRGRELYVSLGAIDDMDTVWCNGVRVGGMERDDAWNQPRRYVVPAAVTEAGEALDILVRVVDTGGEGGFSSPPGELQLGLDDDDAGEGLSLAGTWSRQRGVALAELPPWPRRRDDGPNRPAVLWNAMIAPLAPFPFAGAIWYQGESNRGRAEQYARLFPAMIGDWRAVFDRPLPFHFVQIAPFGYGGERDGSTPALREAQAAALALPRTGMVVTLDIGDAGDIHPANKQDVGRRLALHALRVPYREPVVADGPRPVALERVGAALRVRFAGTEGGLLADAPVGGFEVAGVDGRFAAAQALLAGDAIVVQAAAVPEPVQVRYAWSASPQVTVRNGSGLPAPPFRRSLAPNGP